MVSVMPTVVHQLVVPEDAAAVRRVRVHVEVQHHQLGLLGAVPGAHGAHQLGLVGADAPHHAAAAAALQRHQITDEVALFEKENEVKNKLMV